MKDNFSHFCELWLSDNGSHFKNHVMAELCKRLKCQQNFVVAYCP
ncbi:Retrotransposon protein, Ty3-gypsy subclass [Phytophthora megakarya]|uniref:Retrotransposon protein, Ty3-gypsy subclass n=1 Tax=Phytophthora megakarya TaxID=4795 RepID=A0A225W8B3_9STRA|nr:Retrotransposon protein, Ty3-gypsy subclass [Phytophthora megakarya]